MNADEWVGYGMVLLGVLVACGIVVGVVLWVVLGLMHPWVENAYTTDEPAEEAQ